MDKRTSPITTPFSSTSPAGKRPTNRLQHPVPVAKASRPALVLAAVLIGALMLLTACGPSQSKPDPAQSAAETLRIAQDFAGSGNLDQARQAINDLKVANPHQYLVMRAEDAIANNSDPQAATALVKLTLALNLNSGAIRSYAEKNNLVPTVVAEAPKTNPTIVAALEQASAPAAAAPAAAPAAQAPAAAAPVAQAAASAPITGSAAVTASAPVTSAAGVSSTAGATGPAAADATPTPDPKPHVVSEGLINVRSGPGVDFPVVDALQSAQNVPITGKNPTGDWWEVSLPSGQAGWVLGQLVQAQGDLNTVAVAANIPTPPPTTAPAVADAATPAPAAAAPDASATVTPTTPAGNPSDQPFFKLVNSRMWSKAENGDCRGQHLLRINVIDANGVRLNGVKLKGIYTGEEIVTGSQGKGDGVIEYDLYTSGEGFTVVQNNDGRPASSDRAEGYTTNSRDIPFSTLIAGGYCQDDATCQIFYNSWGCKGHHSWEATFQRNY